MKKTESEILNEKTGCPVGRFFSKLEKMRPGKSGFAEHMSRSGSEFLKALRCLIDERIQCLEKEGAASEKKKSTRINVE